MCSFLLKDMPKRVVFSFVSGKILIGWRTHCLLVTSCLFVDGCIYGSIPFFSYANAQDKVVRNNSALSDLWKATKNAFRRC